MRRALVLVSLGLLALPARAQLAASLGVASDYRWRGVSVSGERPAWIGNLNLDTEAGIYAGLQAATARLRYTQVDALGTTYVGLARRLDGDWSWDLGATASRYRHGSRYNYHEVYAGLAHGRSVARLSLSPHYFGVGGRSAYLEAEHSWSLGGPWEAFLHAGYLRTAARETHYQFQPASRPDARLGLAWNGEAWSAQLAFSATRSNAGLYAGERDPSPRAATLSLSRSW